MKIALRLCHTERITGACGIIKETESCWNLVRRLKPILESYGHRVLIIEGRNDLSDHDQTKEGARIANEWGADVYISFHMNAFNGSARGCEYIVYDSANTNAKTIAKNVCNFMVSLGVPYRREIVNNQFWELKYTSMPATIIELLFCDNSQDVAIWNNTSWDTLVYGICNSIDSNIPKVKPSASKPQEPSISNQNTSYTVKITADVLNVRKGPGVNYAVATTVKKNEVYTIVGEQAGWGKLKSGAGWISLEYTSKASNTAPPKPQVAITVGSKVKITGSKYATGEAVPSWVKSNVYTVQQLNGSKALIKEIVSWVYMKDLILV